VPLCDNVEEYGMARQATDDNIVKSMHFACLITKASHTNSEYVIFITTAQQFVVKAPQCYVLCTVPAF